MIADVILVASVIAFAVAVKEIRSYFNEVGK
jgi:hypothetical protein